MNKSFLYIQRHPLYVLYFIAIPVLLINNLIPGNFDFDSQYYLSAIDNILAHRIDCLRTPVYPLFLYVCSSFGDKYLVLMVTIVQSLLYLISIYFFHQIATKLIESPIISFWITLYYILLPTPNWCSMILTESLSISGMIFITWLLMKDIERPLWNRSCIICLVLIFLIFLRPTFIVFLAIIPATYLYLSIKDKKVYFQVIPLTVIPLCCYLLYCNAFQKEYGLYSSSYSGTCNKIYNLKRGDLWHPSMLTDINEQRVCTYIDSVWDGSYSYLYPLESLAPDDLFYIDNMCNTMISKQKKLYQKWQSLVFLRSCDESLSIWQYNRRTTLGRPLFIFNKLFAIHLSIFYVVIILCFFVSFFKLYRFKIENTCFVLLTGICFTHCVGICYAGAEAYGRLMLPVFPLFLCLTGELANELLNKTIGK